MNLKYIKLLFASVFFTAISVHAQTPVVADEIIVKVDDYIILKSDLEISYNQMRRQGQFGNADLKCQVLENLIINKMLRVQADLDSIFVDPMQVEAELSYRMNIIAQNYGGMEALEEAYGKSMEQIRGEIRDEAEENLLIQQARSSITGNIKVTPAEVRRFFSQFPKDSLPIFSAEAEIGQIVVTPKVSKQVKDRIKANLIEIRQQILDGEVTFEETARRYSMDPGSKNAGGDLGFAARGQMVSQFEAAALKLKPGEISMPVESDFGIHLIKLIERRGNEYHSKHILITPDPNMNDINRTKRFLDSIRTEIINENMSFETAAKEYSEDMMTKNNGGFMQGQSQSSYISMDDLDPVIYFSIDTMEVGEISAPILYTNERGNEAVRLIYYKSRRPPHRANLEDDYQKLAGFALQDKQQEALMRWFEGARGKMYISIDDEYSNCDILN